MIYVIKIMAMSYSLMDVKEAALKAQRLRKQTAELRGRLEAVQRELDETNALLKLALQSAGEDVSEMSEADFQTILAEFNDPKLITVEVVYATRDKQSCSEIQLSPGATVEDGIAVSGLLESFPEIDLSKFKVGIFGVIKPMSHPVKEGDRIEIYRPVESRK